MFKRLGLTLLQIKSLFLLKREKGCGHQELLMIAYRMLADEQRKVEKEQSQLAERLEEIVAGLEQLKLYLPK
ncbi:hypothetical protein [Bacillus sp. 1P06AnD]|uniref:hypothetical protein n=1 Tax=Bacillus sp. 1P06AnD TaxID=3132208 RepID=UPI0039A30A5B